MSSRLLENIINTKIKSDLNTVFYDLIVKHVVTSRGEIGNSELPELTDLPKKNSVIRLLKKFRSLTGESNWFERLTVLQK